MKTAELLKGYKKLRSGRIHLQCPECGRKMSNAPRADWDPSNAVLMVYPCDCTSGNKVEGGDYFDADGKPIEPEF
jgi:hypothetical protein